ncbi:MAG: GAF domain-containing protein, partial [Acidobacteria bacterium]|nr:GAF domain-containing protein [Acidobacteriota bacterium]
MKEWLRTLTEQYGAALDEYLLDPVEPALKKAYELGRQAIAEGVGVLEMAAIYQRTLLQALRTSGDPEQVPAIIERATVFFAESVSSFEMALQAFQSTHQALESERQRYQEQFDFAPDAYLVTERDGTIREANLAAARLLRISQNHLIGKPLLAFLSAGHGVFFNEQLGRLERGETDQFEDWQVAIEPPAAAAFPGAFTVAAIRGVESELLGIRWLLRDISERRRIERERAELLVREQVAHAEAEAARRLAFLAEASTLLAASLDYEATLASVARRAVPYLGDWCFVHVVEDNGAVRCLVTAHSGASDYPEVNPQARDLFLPNPNSTGGIARIIHSGKPEIVDITDPWIVSIAANTAQLTLFRRLGFKSALAAPMIARGRIVGTVTFVVAESGRRYTTVDMALCEDLARRCA